MRLTQRTKLQFLKSAYFWAAMIACASLIVLLPKIKTEIPLPGPVTQDPDAFWQEGMALEYKGDLAQAIVALRRYIDAGGKDVTVFRRLSELYSKTGQLNQALESAQRYVAQAPASADAFFQLGVVYHVLGQAKEAVANYQKAVELDPKLAEALFNLGFISESDGRYLEAIEFYKQAIEANPKHERAYYNLGNSYAALEKDNDAISSYKSAIDNKSDYLDAYVNISIILARNGSIREAIPYLDEARVLGYEAPEEFLKQLEIYREEGR